MANSCRPIGLTGDCFRSTTRLDVIYGFARGTPVAIQYNCTAIGEIHPRVTTVEEQVQTLQTALHGAELQNQQLRTRVAEMESREGTMMSYMLWMEERLTVLEKRLPGPSPGLQ
ncbi:hypothetical protein Tco_0969960 [Tanacetum coccineum]